MNLAPAAPRRRRPIPVTVVAGPTGAGKTRLINRALTTAAFANCAVVLNDFGLTAVTGAVTEAAGEGTIALGSGCVCCTVRGALSEALENLLRDLDNGRLGAIGRVAIEAGAAADPGAIVGMIARHPYLSLRFQADGIVAMAGGAGLAETLAGDAAVVRQLAMADVILINGTVDAGLRRQLAAINPLAQLADASSAPIDDLLGHDQFDPALAAFARIAAATPVRGSGEAGRIRAFAVARERGLSAAAVDRFLDYLAALQGANLLRVLGVIATGENEAVAVQALGVTFHPPLIVDRPAGLPATRFIVVARDLEAEVFAGYLDAFTDEARIDTPDRAALTANPLFIAGFSSRSGRN